MEVKELRDIIKEIHDSGDCGQALSEALEIANKICGQQSDLEIVQKALDKTGRTLRLMPNDRYELIHNESLDLYGRGLSSLLTWAKKTVGAE